MNTAVSNAKADYLARVASGLADLPEEDREEVIQDLRAHLAEVDEDNIRNTLGTPEEFVAEFRVSAGLDEEPGRLSRFSVAPIRRKLEHAGQRLAELTRWSTLRPVWILTRGWLLVSTFAVLTGGTAFRRFPVPVIENSSMMGLALVLLATWLSLWLDRRKTPVREGTSFIYSSVVVLFVLMNMVTVTDLSRSHPHGEEVFYPDQMVGPEGSPIENIHAYDLDGNPVEVLLFDQGGRPLLNLPSWVYGEAERNPGLRPFEYGEGAVEFHADEFGRIIPNLYPLDLYAYGEHGLEQVHPPALGFPGSADTQAGESPVTTISEGMAD